MPSRLVEVGAQIATRSRTRSGLADEHAHDVLVAEARAHDERVREVQVDRVGLAHRAGDAALRQHVFVS